MEAILTSEEVYNVQWRIDQLSNILEINPNAIDELIANPYLFLQGMNIDILEYITDTTLQQEFNNSVRSAFAKMGRIFNRCLACKLSVLTILFALLGKAGLLIIAIGDIIDKLLYPFEILFKKTSKEIESDFEYLHKKLGKFTVDNLAWELCHMHGFCKPLDMKMATVSHERPF